MVREDSVTVPLSSKEKQIIKKKAEREGMTMSGYIRQVLIKGGK